MSGSWRERGIYDEIDRVFKKTIEKHGLQDKEVSCRIIAKGFSGQPPISFPKSEIAEQHFKMPSGEYALTKGKEVLLRCEFDGHYGDSFTDKPKTFTGKLGDMLNMVFGEKGERAIFFGVLNAVFNYLGLVRGTVHCREEEPKECGEQLAAYISDNFGEAVVVVHIGYQPGQVEACSRCFKSYVTDLNPENIGKTKFGRKILDGSRNEDVIKKADVACITGSTIVGGSLSELIRWCEIYGTEPIVYGVTVSAAAKILDLRHFCPYAHEHP